MLMIHRYFDFEQKIVMMRTLQVLMLQKKIGLVVKTLLKALREFERTNNEEDFLKSSDIKEWIKHHTFGITHQKLTNELKKHCVF